MRIKQQFIYTKGELKMKTYFVIAALFVCTVFGCHYANSKTVYTDEALVQAYLTNEYQYTNNYEPYDSYEIYDTDGEFINLTTMDENGKALHGISINREYWTNRFNNWR